MAKDQAQEAKNYIPGLGSAFYIQPDELDPDAIPAAPVAATTTTAGLLKQVAHLDPATATAGDIINAMIAAGNMPAS